VFRAIQKIQAMEEGKRFEVVINVQGDEPFIKPEQLRLLMSCFDDKSIEIATLAKQITQKEELFDPNVVKVIRNKELKAIYFSRSTIPFLRNENQDNWINTYPYLKHIGIYAYKTTILRSLSTLSPSGLELAESLEQNRWIENGYSILVETTKYETIAIDTPEDLEKIQNLAQ
jgi:3-deoxy-manno-octulosonate cytidylyltransferase (CMP-KDO synthetase)